MVVNVVAFKTCFGVLLLLSIVVCILVRNVREAHQQLINQHIQVTVQG